MLGQALPVLALVALAEARAIVTNHCPYNVYVWSVPQVLSSSHTDNVPIKPGGQYREPWRHGSLINPGVAIKISTKADGILKFADEIDFAYVVDDNDDSKIWVDLSRVRGESFKDNLAFHSCLGQYSLTDVHTQQCTATDDVELVLCDTSPRATPEKDHSTLDQVKACYDYGHVNHEDHKDSLQGHVDDDTSSDSDSDTDCCELRQTQSVKFTYTIAMTGEFSGDHTPESAAESMLAPSVDDTSNTPFVSSMKVPSTTSSPSRARLFTPPAPRETDCPECEKPKVLSPCLARVVYPARRRVPATPRNTPNAITPPRQANPSLCEIIRKYHAGVKDCDELALESYARELYPNICDPEYTSLLMGFPCEEIMEELKSVYPGIDGAKVSRTSCQCAADCDFCGHFNDSCFCAGATAMVMRESVQPLPTVVGCFLAKPSDETICLYSLCDPVLPGVRCEKVAGLLDAVLTLFDERYSDWVNETTDTCQSISLLRSDDGQLGFCIADLCDRYPQSCDNIHALLTSATKAKFDLDIVFLKDRATCNKWLEE
jgi:hypothetical protein